MNEPIMIKDLKKLPAETVISGVPLLIKTARPTFWDAEENGWQEVVFMDATGEITGHILLDPQETYEEIAKNHPHRKNIPPQVFLSKQRICVMKATMQETDERRKEAMKIVITECFDLAVRLTFEQRQELTEEEWQQFRQDEIKSKIRCWLVSASITGVKQTKAELLKWQEFVLTGE
jgi:hypothetical protein